REKIVTRGYGPTVREIGEHMNIRSPNGVMCHLKALEKKGMITRKANKSRAIELTESLERQPRVELPVLGAVRNGVCSTNGQSVSGPASSQAIDFGPLMNAEGHAVLAVQDDSLLDIQIRVGDSLVVDSDAVVRTGDLAIVRISDTNGAPALVVRFVFFDEGQIKLQSANRSVPPTVVDQVDSAGVVVGVVRQFRRGTSG
ncbi:MAG: transcriptional repressor LexA, partial [Planctomycetota bacterium]